MAAVHFRLLQNVGKHLQKNYSLNSSFSAFSTASTIRKNEATSDPVTHTGQVNFTNFNLHQVFKFNLFT